MISINATLVIQVIHFLILLYVLNRFMFQPILRLMDERDQHIEKTEKGVDEALGKTEELKQSFVSKVHQTRRDAAQERSELRESGIAETRELLERYKKKTEGIMAETDKEADEQVAMARPLMHDQVIVLAESVIEKMLGRRLEVESEN